MEPSPFLLSEEEQEEENRRQMEAFAAAQLGQAPPKPKPPLQPSAPRTFSRPAFATGNNSMMNHGASGAYHAAVGAQQQGQALGNMISQTMGAYQDEHDSRVAQMREARRMQHEREMKQMELDALLARIQAARG